MYNNKRTFNFRDESTLYDAMRLYHNLSNSFNPFFDELTELFNYTVAKLQWDQTIRAELRKARRPANSYNLIRTILNVIFSVERDNRRKGKASPRTGGDNELAQIVTQTIDFYLYHAGFSKAQKRVFMDKIVARMGVYHLGWKYEGSTDDKGKLFVEANDPREFMWEINYNDPLWEESSYIMRKHEMSLEELIETYALNDDEMRQAMITEAKSFLTADPERGKWISRKLKALFAAVYETATGFSSNNDNLFRNYLQWWNPATNKFDVLELHEKRTELRLIVDDFERGQQVDITEPYRGEYMQLEGTEPDGYNYDAEIINRIKDRYSLQGDAKSDLMQRRFVTAAVPAFYMKVNEQPYPFETRYYVYIPDICYDTHADPLKLQSVVDDLIDPQSDFNKSKSLILELTARYANKGWILDENAISGLEEDWATNRIAPYRRIRSGYINMIKPEEGQTISPEVVRMPLETMQLMKVITNAEDEIRGQRTPGVTSGKHFIAKEERQAKSFASILENRDNSQKAVYELALNFAQHYVTGQEVIRITQDIMPGIKEDRDVTVNQKSYEMQNGQIQESVINDITAHKYDTEIVDEPYSTSAQENRYEKLGNVFNAALAVDQRKANAMLPIMVQASNTPEGDKIIETWKQLDEPNPQEQQMQQLVQAVQQIMMKLGIAEKKTEVEGKQLDNVEKAKRIKQMNTDNIFRIMDMKNRNGKKQKQEAA